MLRTFTRSRQKPRRQRGVVLTPTGWQKLEEAIRKSKIQQSSIDRYTLQVFSDRTGLDRRTVARVLDRIEVVDLTTLLQFFRAFNLELDRSDYTIPAPNLSESESVFAYTRQDLREAVDVSIFYGRTSELTLLKQWVINERCRLLALLGIGGIGKTALATKLADPL